MEQLELIEDLGMIYPTESSKKKARYGLYRCSCGKEFKAQASNVSRKITNSCGCYKSNRISELNRKTKTKHSLCDHRLYNTWKRMNIRCNSSSSSDFEYYGARGVKVCERWKSFKSFLDDMLPSYEEGLTLDRIDVNGNYEPSNCRWVHSKVQRRNTRKIMSTNTSGYRGVSFNKQINKWSSVIGINKKRKHIGYFDDPKHAAMAYDTFVIVYGLEHTCNFPKGVF